MNIGRRGGAYLPTVFYRLYPPIRWRLERDLAVVAQSPNAFLAEPPYRWAANRAEIAFRQRLRSE